MCCSSPSPPSPPPAPNPSEQIVAQAKAQPSLYTPYGSRVYSGDPTVSGSYQATETLSPEMKAQFDAKNRIAQAILGRTETALPSLPASPYKFRGAEDPTTNALWMNEKKLLDTQFQREDERERQRLVNQGIPEGSQAYREAMDDFGRRKADAYSSAATKALGAGYQQDITTRQQNLNEIAQALGGSQLQPIGGAGSPIDTASAYANQQAALNRQYQGQMAGYNAEVGANNATMGGLFSLGAAALPLIFSDRRLKRDIVCVGEFMPGVPWYAFRYVWEDETQPLHHGVMADEVEPIFPEAVHRTEEGYAVVDYAVLFGKRTLH